MSTLKGISAKRLFLVINAVTAYLSVTQGGYTLEDLGLEWIYPLVTPAHALFRATDEEVDEAGRVLRATIDRLNLRRVTREEALITLREQLSEMKAAMKRVPLNANLD